MLAKIIVATEMISAKSSFLDKYNEMKETREKKNIERKNLGKIVLKTALAFSGLNFVKITEVFIPTWNSINPMVNPVASNETNSYMKHFI